MFGGGGSRGHEYAALAEEDDALIALLPPVKSKEEKEKDEDSGKGKKKASSDKKGKGSDGDAAASKEAAGKESSEESVTSCYVELNGRTVAVANTKTKSAVIVLGRYGGKAVNFACLGKCPVMSRKHGSITYDDKRECYLLSCSNDRCEFFRRSSDC